VGMSVPWGHGYPPVGSPPGVFKFLSIDVCHDDDHRCREARGNPVWRREMVLMCCVGSGS